MRRPAERALMYAVRSIVDVLVDEESGIVMVSWMQKFDDAAVFMYSSEEHRRHFISLTMSFQSHDRSSGV